MYITECNKLCNSVISSEKLLYNTIQHATVTFDTVTTTYHAYYIVIWLSTHNYHICNCIIPDYTIQYQVIWQQSYYNVYTLYKHNKKRTHNRYNIVLQPVLQRFDIIKSQSGGLVLFE